MKNLVEHKSKSLQIIAEKKRLLDEVGKGKKVMIEKLLLPDDFAEMVLKDAEDSLKMEKMPAGSKILIGMLICVILIIILSTLIRYVD